MEAIGINLPALVFEIISLSMILILTIGSIFWIWMIIEAATKEASEGNDKITWIIIIVFTHVLGALLYFFVRRPKRKADLGT